MTIDTAIEIAVLTPGDAHCPVDEARNMRLGAELAVQDINEAGGLTGERLRLATYDTGDMSPASVAGAVSLLLLEGRAQCAVTGYASGTAFEAQLLADAHLPYVLAEHSIQLQRRIAADPERYATVWGLIPSYDPYGEETAKKLMKLGETVLPTCRRRAFLINSDNDYSSRCAEGLAVGLVRGGWTLVGGATVEPGQEPAWEATVREAKEGEADLVLSTAHSVADAAALSRAFRASEMKALLFIQYGPKYREYSALAGDAANGVFFNVLGGPIDVLPATKELRSRFFAAYEFYPDRYGMDVYQAVQLYAEAVLAVGSPWDTEAVGRQIGQLRLEATQGTVSFDPLTHLARTGDDAVPMQWFQYHGGEKVCFAPQALATGSFELPPWLAPGG